MTGHVKVDGAWKSVTSLSTKVDGAWKSVASGHTRVDGVWKQWYSATAPASFELISSTILPTTSTATITFSSIPEDYKHLQLRISAQSDRSGLSYTGVVLRLNNNTSTTSHAAHRLQADGSAITSTYSGTANNIPIGRVNGASQTAPNFNAIVVDILDYSNATKNTTTRTLFGSLTGSNSVDHNVGLGSGLYINTDVISRLDVITFSANYLAGSRFSLYGIRG